MALGEAQGGSDPFNMKSVKLAEATKVKLYLPGLANASAEPEISIGAKPGSADAAKRIRKQILKIQQMLLKDSENRDSAAAPLAAGPATAPVAATTTGTASSLGAAQGAGSGRAQSAPASRVASGGSRGRRGRSVSGVHPMPSVAMPSIVVDERAMNSDDDDDDDEPGGEAAASSAPGAPATAAGAARSGAAPAAAAGAPSAGSQAAAVRTSGGAAGPAAPVTAWGPAGASSSPKAGAAAGEGALASLTGAASPSGRLLVPKAALATPAQQRALGAPAPSGSLARGGSTSSPNDRESLGRAAGDRRRTMPQEARVPIWERAATGQPRQRPPAPAPRVAQAMPPRVVTLSLALRPGLPSSAAAHGVDFGEDALFMPLAAAAAAVAGTARLGAGQQGPASGTSAAAAVTRAATASAKSRSNSASSGAGTPTPGSRARSACASPQRALARAQHDYSSPGPVPRGVDAAGAAAGGAATGGALSSVGGLAPAPARPRAEAEGHSTFMPLIPPSQQQHPQQPSPHQTHSHLQGLHARREPRDPSGGGSLGQAPGERGQASPSAAGAAASSSTPFGGHMRSMALHKLPSQGHSGQGASSSGPDSSTTSPPPLLYSLSRSAKGVTHG